MDDLAGVPQRASLWASQKSSRLTKRHHVRLRLRLSRSLSRSLSRTRGMEEASKKLTKISNRWRRSCVS